MARDGDGAGTDPPAWGIDPSRFRTSTRWPTRLRAGSLAPPPEVEPGAAALRELAYRLQMESRSISSEQLYRLAAGAVGAPPDEELELIGSPSGALPGAVRPGDLLMRDTPTGDGPYGGVIVSGMLETPSELAGRGIPSETGGPGGYVEVLETPVAGGVPYLVGRRLTDPEGMLPRGQAVYRACSPSSPAGYGSGFGSGFEPLPGYDPPETTVPVGGRGAPGRRRFIPVAERLAVPSPRPPSLPDELPGLEDLTSTVATSAGIRPGRIPVHSLRNGCYLLRYSPRLPALHYDGTLRVERRGENTTASGDLYLHRLGTGSWPGASPPEPNPAGGIPILARAQYRYYLRITRILESVTFSTGFTLGFEMHRFDHATGRFSNEGTYTAALTWMTPPSGYPAGADYLTGPVTTPSGGPGGTLAMGWVSDHLRRAVFEIDRVAASEVPLNNGAAVSWRTIFDTVGWDVTVDVSDANVSEPSGESWSDAELHAGMLARRRVTSLDNEWRYHVLAVRRLDSTTRGIMYDASGSDSNNVPREGCGIATHWMVPDVPLWGQIRNSRFGTATAAYFRTAVHELGHALGLYHNTANNGIMNTTDVIAGNATAAAPFPTNILWAFAADDQKRLRHMPDVWVRPGGIPFGSEYSTVPISPDDMISDALGLELQVSPLLESVPIGAPVRVNVALVNVSERPLPVPASLSLKSGFVKGTVLDPAGTVRSFSPIIRCLEEHELRMLPPGGRIESSLTLLRGAQGALFSNSGVHTVTVEVDWELAGGGTMGVAGETTVLVTPAVTREHELAAERILSTPDALLTLVFGGDHLEEGIAAIHAGMDSEVLRPHFTVIEAKRVGERFGSRPARLDEAARLLDADAVMSPAEARSTARIVADAAERAPLSHADAVQRLRVRIAQGLHAAPSGV